MSDMSPALDAAAGGVFLAVRRVAVGSTNPAKVAAVAQAVARLWPAAAVEGVAVPSGVAAQPRTDHEGARGALQRAATARTALDADLGLGLEGSTDEQPFGTWTLAWVGAVDRAGRVGLASTARCPLPAPIAAAIREGGELGPLVDRLLSEQDTKHRGGASGAFTAGHTGRRDSLAGGVIYACAPFLTPQYFGPDGMGQLPAVLAALDEARPLRLDYTLVFLRRPDGRVLFLHRERPPNRGRLNGLGGGIEPGEDAVTAAAREVQEEVGATVTPHLGLVVTFWETGRVARGEPPIQMYVCRADVDAATARAIPATCPEGALTWLDPTDLAGQPVVPNLPILLPILLARTGGAILATLWYEADWQGGHYLLHLPDGPRRGIIPA